MFVCFPVTIGGSEVISDKAEEELDRLEAIEEVIDAIDDIDVDGVEL